jgi:hypothetical protein
MTWAPAPSGETELVNQLRIPAGPCWPHENVAGSPLVSTALSRAPNVSRVSSGKSSEARPPAATASDQWRTAASLAAKTHPSEVARNARPG